MTIINIRNADGFTFHDNLYQIPGTMSVDHAGAFVSMVDERATEGEWSWDGFNDELAEYGIVVAYDVDPDSAAAVFDVDF